MLTRTKNIYYPEYVPRVCINHYTVRGPVYTRAVNATYVILVYVQLDVREGRQTRNARTPRVPYNVLDPAV